MKTKITNVLRIVASGIMAVAMTQAVAYAANTTDLTQTINAGTLTTDIRDASRVTVAAPSVAMSAVTSSFSCLSGGSASTGTLGSNTQRLYVDNPDSADNGWTLTIAATSGATDVWDNAGVTQTYDFNDAGGSGCTDGADADTRPGQLTIDATPGVLTADCGGCATTNITKGSSASFSQSVVDSVTLLNAAAASNDSGRWYLTGASLSQTIPAEQAADSYSINLTLTATAL